MAKLSKRIKDMYKSMAIGCTLGLCVYIPMNYGLTNLLINEWENFGGSDYAVARCESWVENVHDRQHDLVQILISPSKYAVDEYIDENKPKEYFLEEYND
ncbi:MAG: hypothetical protein L6408_03640 [Nanoarchaeota archaeon]|nr:hypothetical protein [Nanoarchaeota archaeon]